MKSTFLRIVGTISLVTLTGYIPNFVDCFFIGTYIGSEAMAAFGMAFPILVFFTAFVNMLNYGSEQVYSRTLGTGNADEAGRVMGAAWAWSVVVGISLVLLVIIFLDSVAAFMAAESGEVYVNHLKAYFTGFFPGMILSPTITVIESIFQLNGRYELGASGAIIITVTNLLFNALNAFIFHWGMFGVGLTTALSWLLGALWVIIFMIRYRHEYHIKINLRPKYMKAFVQAGLAEFMFSLGESASGLFLVKLIQAFGSAAGVAVFAIISNVWEVLCVPVMAITESLLLLGSFYAGARDRENTISAIRTAMTCAISFGLILILLVFMFAPEFSRLVSNSEQAAEIAVWPLRLYMLAIIPEALIRVLSAANLINKKFTVSRGLLFLQSLPLMCACAYLLAPFLNVWPASGQEFWLYRAAAAVCCLLIYVLGTTKNNGTLPTSAGELAMIAKDFGVPDDCCENYLAANIEECVDISERSRKFLLAKGATEKQAYFMSLYIEEVTTNVFLHSGTESERASRKVRVRLFMYEGQIKASITDKGPKFNPFEWVKHHEYDPEHPAKGLGLRIITGLAKDTEYMRVVDTNNMMISLS